MRIIVGLKAGQSAWDVSSLSGLISNGQKEACTLLGCSQTSKTSPSFNSLIITLLFSKQFVCCSNQTGISSVIFRMAVGVLRFANAPWTLCILDAQCTSCFWRSSSKASGWKTLTKSRKASDIICIFLIQFDEINAALQISGKLFSSIIKSKKLWIKLINHNFPDPKVITSFVQHKSKTPKQGSKEFLNSARSWNQQMLKNDRLIDYQNSLIFFKLRNQINEATLL